MGGWTAYRSGGAGAGVYADLLGECRRDGSRSGIAVDAELLHAGLEGGALEVQNPGGAALTADPPAGLLENREDVTALDLLVDPTTADP